MICFPKFKPFVEGSYVFVGCFQRSWVALNLFPTSLLHFFLYGGKITPSQTSRGTSQSLGAHRATPCPLGYWIPKSNKCFDVSRYELGCSRMDLKLTSTQSLFPIYLPTPTLFSSQISSKSREGEQIVAVECVLREWN
jgi:hypothetical protein